MTKPGPEAATTPGRSDFMGLKLIGEVGLDGSGFERGLSRLGSTAASRMKQFVVGAFGIYGVEQAIQKTVESADELVTASKRLDITIEQLQVLRQAAKDNSVEFDKLATAFEKIDVAREKAMGGGPEGMKALAAFGQLGISLQQLRTMTAAALFTGPMHQAAGRSNVEDLAGPLREIFSRGFGEIIPVLKTDFVELGAKMKSMGTIMDTETAVELKYIGDSLSLVSQILTAQLGPALLWLAQFVLNAIGPIKAFGAWLGSLSGGKGGLIGGLVGEPVAAAIARERLEDAKLNPAPYTPEMIAAFHQIVAEQADRSLAAKEARDKVLDEWRKTMDDFRAKLAKIATDLRNPKPPSFAPQPPGGPERRRPLSHEDALIRVGNFLGTSKDAITRLAEQQVQLLRQIANNTRPRSTVSGLGDWDRTFFPLA